MKKIIYPILHNIRSCYNVGSIFRTADAFGIKKIFLTGYTPTPENQKIKKTSLGAENFVPWKKHKNISELILILRKKNFKIIALEQTKKSIFVFNYKGENSKIALVIGNEIRGLNHQILKIMDKTIEIPMLGKKESLNVAVAFGIGIYALKYNRK